MTPGISCRTCRQDLHCGRCACCMPEDELRHQVALANKKPVISAAQLTRLQTLYSKFAAGDLGVDVHSREARLAWAARNLGRTIESFRDLTRAEAQSLISVLQVSLGIPETRPARRPRSRAAARAAGIEGRRGAELEPSTIATAADLALVDRELQKLGWTQERFQAWLRSPSSPLRRQANPQIRTLGDVNKVLWPLKKMARRALQETR